MKATTKLFHVIIWLALTLAGFNVLAAKEPLYDGLGSYSRKITTNSAEAQRYFDQGFAFLHGFNHRAAIRAFQQAAEIDPNARWRTGAYRSRAVHTLILSPFHRLQRSLRGRNLSSLEGNPGTHRRLSGR